MSLWSLGRKLLAWGRALEPRRGQHVGTGQVNDGTRWNSTFVADPWGHAMESSTQGPNTQKPAESLELNGAQRAELKSSAGRIRRSHPELEGP